MSDLSWMFKVALVVVLCWVMGLWGWHSFKKVQQDIAEDRMKRPPRRVDRGQKSMSDLAEEYKKKRAEDRVKRGYFSDDP